MVIIIRCAVAKPPCNPESRTDLFHAQVWRSMSVITREFSPDVAPFMVKCCLVIKDGGRVSPSPEREAIASPGVGELLGQAAACSTDKFPGGGRRQENRVSCGDSLASGMPIQVVVEDLKAEVANM